MKADQDGRLRMMRTPRTSWEKIREVYLREKSIRKTATVLGTITKSGVGYALGVSGVVLFPRSRKGGENSNRKAIAARPWSAGAKVRDPVLMRRLYVAKRLSLPKIGRLLGVSNTTVLTGLRQCGISPRTKSEAIRGVPRPSMQGAKNPAWKGGVTKWRKLAREALNAVFVRPVMERDGFRCQWCRSLKKLTVHHVRPFSVLVKLVKKRLGLSTGRRLIHAIVKEHKLEDGITICKACHDAHHKEHGK